MLKAFVSLRRRNYAMSPIRGVWSVADILILDEQQVFKARLCALLGKCGESGDILRCF